MGNRETFSVGRPVGGGDVLEDFPGRPAGQRRLRKSSPLQGGAERDGHFSGGRDRMNERRRDPERTGLPAPDPCREELGPALGENGVDDRLPVRSEPGIPDVGPSEGDLAERRDGGFGLPERADRQQPEADQNERQQRRNEPE